MYDNREHRDVLMLKPAGYDPGYEDEFTLGRFYRILQEVEGVDAVIAHMIVGRLLNEGFIFRESSRYRGRRVVEETTRRDDD